MNEDKSEFVDSIFDSISNLDNFTLVGLDNKDKKELRISENFEGIRKMLIVALISSFLMLQVVWLI